MLQYLPYGTRLNRDAGLTHHLCAFADPDDEDELHAFGFGIVGIFYACICVLGLRGVELPGQFGESTRAGAGEGELVASVRGV